MPSFENQNKAPSLIFQCMQPSILSVSKTFVEGSNTIRPLPVISTVQVVNKLFERMAEHGVKVLTSAAVQEVKENAIVYKKGDEIIEITNVDTTVIAIGVRANTALEDELKGSGYKVVSVGDCHERAKNGYRSIQEGYEAGINV